MTPPSPDIRLSCHCGSIELTLSGSPAARAYCHCRACRDFYGLPLLAATAWSPEAVSVTRGAPALGEYKPPERQMRRFFCQACGETLLGTNRLAMRVIRNSLLARAHGGGLPAALQPQFHLFYASRELDVDDALPKYLEGWDGPLFTGGSATDPA